MIETLASRVKVIQIDCLEAGALDKIVLYTSGEKSRVLVIRDPRPNPEWDAAIADLSKKHEVLSLDKVNPNPSSSDIMTMVEEAKSFNATCVLGFGGGSALDSAKAVAMVLNCGGDLDEYLGPSATRKPEQRKIKLILFPTTTGTGAEVTKFGVYTDRKGRKYTLNSIFLEADAACLVTKFVLDIPAPLLAATGFDALTHALEAVWNKNATALSLSLAKDAAVAVLTSYELAYDERVNTNSVKAQSSFVAELFLAACKAGIAFNQTGTAAIHALSFILSEEWHLNHGSACAFFAEDIVANNCKDPEVLKEIASIVRSAFFATETGSQTPKAPSDTEALEYLLTWMRRLKEKTGLLTKFSQIKANADQVETLKNPLLLSELFAKSFDDPKMKNNSVLFTPEMLFEILKKKCV